MSVILDALQKARGDKHKNQVEPHPNSVARVLDPATPAGLEPAKPHRRGLGLAVAIIVGVILTVALAGGAFFLLYDQMRRLQNHAAPPVAVPAIPPAQFAPALATPSLESELAVPAGSLPTPLPEAELPIQPPAGSLAAAGNSTVYSAPTAASVQPTAVAPAAVPEFKLGSIVCENNICMALINGRTVREGDRIKDYIVAQITDKGVILKSATGSDEVHLDLYN